MAELTQDQKAQILSLLESGQLGNLVDPRLQPSRQLDSLENGPFDPKNPKPTFFIHDVPLYAKNTHETFPYPRLLWRPDGIEVTVNDKNEHGRLMAAGYSETAPVTSHETDEERAQREFDLLSPEDQAFVLEQSEIARKDRLAAMAKHLPIVQKRGPGRPRKVLA